MEAKAERARRVAEAMRGRTVAWLADAVGCALSTAHSYVKGTVPPADVAMRVADALGVDLRWYVSGEGQPSAGPRDPADLVRVPLVDLAFRPAGFVPYPRELLAALCPDPDAIRCIFPSGNAMRPTVPEGAEVLFGPLPPSGMSDGRVYVLAVGSQAVVRRVRLSAGGQWTAVCDNPAFRKEDPVPVSPKAAVGEVLWVSHRP